MKFFTKNTKTYFIVLLLAIFNYGTIGSIYASNGKISNTYENTITQIESTKISVNMVNKPLKDIMVNICENSSIKYTVEKGVNIKSNKRYSLTIKDVTVKDALSELFLNTPYDYTVNDNGLIVIINKHTVPIIQNNERITVNGTVVNNKGKAIVGATILVKNSNAGAISDDKGQFIINTTVGTTLEVSFIGYKDINHIVTSKDNTLVITMEQDALEVEEVIVTGLFTRDKESFSGAAKTMTKTDLQRVSNGNLFQSLKNLDPSLNIPDNLEFGSDPNQMPSMQLRGTSTFPIDENDLRSQYENDPNSPLFILDGFETTAQRIFDLDVNRVMTVTILKDAAAKAIYGSKAANGVVVIETKKVSGGGILVSYKGSLDITAPDLTSYNLTDALQKLQVELEGGVYESSSLSTQQSLQRQYNARMNAALAGVDTDWLSKPLTTGIGTKHSLSVEMADEKIQVIGDFSYYNNDGVMIGSGRSTINGSLMASYRLSDKLLFRNSMSIASNNATDSPYGDFSEYAEVNPYYTPYDEYGNIVRNLDTSVHDGVANPLYNSTINTSLKSSYLQFTNNFYIEYQVLSGLKLIGRVGVDTRRDDSDRFYPASHTKFNDYPDEDIFRKGSYEASNGKYFNISSDVILQYSKIFGKHLLTGNFAYSVSEKEDSQYWYNAEGFPSDYMNDITYALQYAENTTPSGTESIVRDMGITALVGYAYDDKYMADLTIRQNASSQFGTNKRWGTFWSLGAAWNIHKENGMSAFNLLKLRGSIGTTGSQNFSSYQAITTYKYYTDASYGGMLGAYIMRLANEDLAWQSKLDYNVGLDVQFKGLSATFDYYRSYTNSLITDLSLAPSTGYDTVKENVGKILNTGFEASLSYRLYSGRNGFFNITASAVTNDNEILELSDAMRAYNARQDELANSSLEGGRSEPVLRYVTGGSLNSIWGVKSLGINPANGLEIYEKLDGSTTYTWDPADQQILGNTIERIRGNIGFNGEYKNIGFGLGLRFTEGADYYNSTLVAKVENADITKNVDIRLLEGRWSENNTDAPYKRLSPYNDAEGNYILIPATKSTSRFVQLRNELDISYLNVYYDFSKMKFVERAGLNRLRLTLNMNDIYKFSSIEVERGTAYPFARTISLSLTAEF